jgi:hypothetical protein
VTRHLYDAETNDDLGPATDAQIVVSDAAAERYDGVGIILIDEDGDPISEQAAERLPEGQGRPTVRRVYVER